MSEKERVESLHCHRRKLIDYTKHRRDDMPSMTRECSSRKEDWQHSVNSSISSNQQFSNSLSALSSPIVPRDIEDDRRIDFLFKIPSFRRRNSELSREELLLLYEQRNEHNDDDTSSRSRRASAVDVRNTKGKRSTLIERLLRQNFEANEEDDDASSTTVVTYHRSRNAKKSLQGARAA